MKSLFRKILPVVIVVLLLTIFTVPVLARSLHAGLHSAILQLAPPTSAELAAILLGIYGAALSLVFTYLPEARAWFEALPHQGIVMLGMILALAAIYLGLSCTPFAAQLHITLACAATSVFDLLEAVFAIAVGNQLTYLFTPTPKAK